MTKDITFIFLFIILFLLNLDLIKKNRKYIFIVLMTLFILLAFQKGVGTDYYSYIDIYNGKKEFFYHRGIGVMIIIQTLRYLKFSYQSFFIIISLIQILLLYTVIKRLKKIVGIEFREKIFLFFLITTTNFYLSMFNTLRQSVANMFCILAIIYFFYNRKGRGLILIFLGMLFHPIVLIYSILLGLIKKLKVSRYKTIISGIVIGMIVQETNLIIKFAHFIYLSKLEFYYKFYLVSEHMRPYIRTFGIGKIINLLIILLSLKIYRNEKNYKQIFLLNLGYFYEIVMTGI